MRHAAMALLLALATPTMATAAATKSSPAAPLAAALKPAPLLSSADNAAYRAIFVAFHAGDLTGAGRALDALAPGVLTPVARAELLLAKGAAPADPAMLAALLATAPELPQAPALLRLARAQGVDPAVALPSQQRLLRQAAASKRVLLHATRNDAATAQLARQAAPLVKADDAPGLEALVEAAAATLSPEALTEWRARTAWCYYLTGADADALRVAALAHDGIGDWIVQADWTAGLAAWRTHDRATAAARFAEVASLAQDAEMTAAGYYWSARATADDRPADARQRLLAAARQGETFYGMLALTQLGGDAPVIAVRATAPADDTSIAMLPIAPLPIAMLPNVRAAIALGEIGETALADQLLRQQARIGRAQDHAALLTLAARLRLPSTQVWLAQNCPAGAALPASARFPTPDWQPSAGWRVDKALLFAHALQESQFRADAVSPAGARGLMQLMPATARLVARHKGLAEADAGRLDDPAASLEYGQSYLEELADGAGTGGLLPKVIAAYNAGPRAVAAWTAKGLSLDDPLLFIESIPYAETRGYVTTVLRNYWMYQRQVGERTDSLAALSQGVWPRFPALAGRTARGTIMPPREPARAGYVPTAVTQAAKVVAFVRTGAPAPAGVGVGVGVEHATTATGTD